MRAARWALVGAVLVLAACHSEFPFEQTPLPRVNEGGWLRLLGSGRGDVWLVQADEAHELLFFHSSGGAFVPVPTPEELRDIGATYATAGPGALLIGVHGTGSETWLARFEADGSLERLDVAGLAPDAPSRRIGIKPASDGNVVYVVVEVTDLPTRVYRRDGASWTELASLASRGANPLAVVDGDLWLMGGDGVRASVLQLRRDGELVDHGTNGTSDGFYGVNLAATGPNDVWVGAQHWDGSSWSPPIEDELRVPMERGDSFVGQFQSVALAVGPGALEILAVATYHRYGHGRGTTELWSTRVTREGGASSPRRITTLASRCDGPCPSAYSAALVDGTAAIQLDASELRPRTLVLVGPDDL